MTPALTIARALSPGHKAALDRQISNWTSRINDLAGPQKVKYTTYTIYQTNSIVSGRRMFDGINQRGNVYLRAHVVFNFGAPNQPAFTVRFWAFKNTTKPHWQAQDRANHKVRAFFGLLTTHDPKTGTLLHQ